MSIKINMYIIYTPVNPTSSSYEVLWDKLVNESNLNALSRKHKNMKEPLIGSYPHPSLKQFNFPINRQHV